MVVTSAMINKLIGVISNLAARICFAVRERGKAELARSEICARASRSLPAFPLLIVNNNTVYCVMQIADHLQGDATVASSCLSRLPRNINPRRASRHTRGNAPRDRYIIVRMENMPSPSSYRALSPSPSLPAMLAI